LRPLSRVRRLRGGDRRSGEGVAGARPGCGARPRGLGRLVSGAGQEAADLRKFTPATREIEKLPPMGTSAPKRALVG
jgi:hypothetical protein